MKKRFLIPIFVLCFIILTSEDGCEEQHNHTAVIEQNATEANQAQLLAVQPPPKLTWSLERDNLIKRFKLQNDRSVMFYMYIFNEGVADPIGYYQVNKVSSVNSQLTNTMQIMTQYTGNPALPSPAEDGSYGTNGDGVFGFTPEDIYIEHNMHYICATVPLSFTKPVTRLTIINIKTAEDLKTLMAKISKK